ncbi:MAG: FHA domain-containing protein [Chloroflexota bacterium]
MQLEIIGPDGSVQFYNLNANQGYVNIGRAPSNDIQLVDANVAMFQAMLDYRQTPYQFVVLSPEGNVRVDGQPLPVNQFVAVSAQSSIQIADYMLIVLQPTNYNPQSPTAAYPTPATPDYAQGTPVGVAQPTNDITGATQPFPQQQVGLQPGAAAFNPALAGAAGAGLAGSGIAAAGTAGAGAPPAVNPAAVGPDGLPIPPAQGVNGNGFNGNGFNGNGAGPQQVTTGPQAIPDFNDDVIIVRIEEGKGERTQTVHVENTASWEITIINGGPLVANFEVYVEGWIDEKWVNITQTSMNLYEGDRASSVIYMTPPREPQSTAGPHHFAIVVTSHNYPGHRAQIGATLDIIPYYEYRLADVVPRQQSLSYFRESGTITYGIHNRSNTPGNFLVSGSDDELACTFEYTVPGEEARLVGQAEFLLEPDEIAEVPVEVTPKTRRLIAASGRNYSLNLSTNMTDSDLGARSVIGQLRKQPLLGPWIITLMAILLAIFILIIFRPRINSFELVNNDNLQPALSQDISDVAIDSTSSGSAARAPRFLGLRIPRQAAQAMRFLPGVSIPSEEEETEEIPPEERLAVKRGLAFAGRDVITQWDVSTTVTTLNLYKQVNGVEQLLGSVVGPIGSQNVQADLDATYILRASNWIQRIPLIGPLLGIVDDAVVLDVEALPPEVISFEVSDGNIQTGEPVVVRWEVTEADDYVLEVNGVVDQTLPSEKGSLQFEPEERTTYRLVARNQFSPQEASQSRQVRVLTPTPTAIATPEIRFFGVQPNPIVDGDLVQLSWDVGGANTVEILPTPGLVPNFEGSDEVMVEEGQSQETFIIIASAGDGIRTSEIRATRVISIVTPTPTQTGIPTETPTPTPSLTPSPTPTETPIPVVIQDFRFSDNPVERGSVAADDLQIIWLVSGFAPSIEIKSSSLGTFSNLTKEGTLPVSTLPEGDVETYQIVIKDNSDNVLVSQTLDLNVTEPPTPEPPTPIPAPVIATFASDQETIVAGESVILSWEVSDFGGLTITPFGVTSSDASGQQSVTLSQAGAQEITLIANNSGVETSNSILVTVLDRPVITFFRAENGSTTQAADTVLAIQSTDNVATYQVVAGSQVRLTWTVANAESVTLDGYGDFGTQDELVLTINTGGLFTLSAVQLGTIYDTATLRLEVPALDPPDAPTLIAGIYTDAATPPTVRWEYAQEEQIIGFRVYRAPTTTFDFEVVANENTGLANTTRSFTDPLTPSCGLVYYVTAVYLDITEAIEENQIKESQPSQESWFTSPCN